MSVPGLVIAAARSGSGKTILTLGLMRALARRGVRIVGRKNGPDYIDPAFHAAVTGRPSLNLDSWAMPDPLLRRLATVDPAEADLVLCEGSMGLFDGVPAAGRSERLVGRCRGIDRLAGRACPRLLRTVADRCGLDQGLRAL